ncbi:MAG: SDR family NAD(P)-dependent oxidoreductase, partial [Balneolaceae bacterium]|nr:SDR family NAD(P)-dependent oxidoreductase [Balneolaceae bacterium]
MNSYYENKKILITGAASGIGRLFASKVTEAGNVTLILWDQNSDALHAFKKELSRSEKAGVDVHVSALDISDPDRILMESEHLKKEGLLPDIIINCAAIVKGSYFHEHTIEEIEKSIRINTLGSMWVVQTFLSDMIERGSGRVVNMGSASGYIGNPRMSVYA